MSKRQFLRIIFMTMFSLPVVAMADDTVALPIDTSNDLIKRESGALCNVDYLGIYASATPVPFYAHWAPRTYTCNKGQYVKVTDSSVECEICPKDSYCPKFNEEGASHTYVPDESSYGIFKCDSGYTTEITGNETVTGNSDSSACRKRIECSEVNPWNNIAHATAETVYLNEWTICGQPVDGVQVCDLRCDISELKCEWGYKPKKEEDVWSCEKNFVTCSAGEYLKAGETVCSACPENSFCTGGDYLFADAEGEDQGIENCIEGLKSQSGSTSVKDCGIVLRVDGVPLYMRSERVENGKPAFVVLKRIQGVDTEKWYATMTPVTEGIKEMSKNAGKELHVKIGTVEYTIHSVTSKDLAESSGQ